MFIEQDRRIKVHSALSIIERQASILQVATDCKNQGRKTDDKQSFVHSYFVSISNSIELKKKKCDQNNKAFIFAEIYKIPLIQ